VPTAAAGTITVKYMRQEFRLNAISVISNFDFDFIGGLGSPDFSVAAMGNIFKGVPQQVDQDALQEGTIRSDWLKIRRDAIE
jgi:hypothetical protein